jgi:hypothetical protein
MSTFAGEKKSQKSCSPLGNGSYVVQHGDCLESIAFTHGLLWQTIWNDPRNAELQTSRDPNILLPGDRLFIPELKQKSTDCATDQLHTFERKGVNSRVRIHVLEWVLSNVAGTNPPDPAPVTESPISQACSTSARRAPFHTICLG